MTRRRLVVGNWKMNTTLEEAVSLARDLKDVKTSAEVVVCPPMPWLVPVKEALSNVHLQGGHVGIGIKLGAQNAFPGGFGAETGSVSVGMLAPHINFVIIGHSERRTSGRDTHTSINAKVKSVLKNRLTPVICVGEFVHLYDGKRNRGRPSAIEAASNIFKQLRLALEGVKPSDISRLVIAYEPVWAIGTGQAATPEYANDMITTLRKALAKHADRKRANQARIIYGGSVTANNAGGFAKYEEIDGALVGGASLKSKEFQGIVKAFSKEAE